MMGEASSDLEILASALDIARRAYEQKTSHHTLLSRPPPDSEILAPIANAIEQCAAYKQVAGHFLYSAGGVLGVYARPLASSLFYRGSDDSAEAAAWLLRLLSVRVANGSLKAAVWGVSITQTVQLSSSSRLVPFADLPNSYMKRRIIDRSKQFFDQAVWQSTNFFAVPGVAYVRDAPDFPYICSDNSSVPEFQKFVSEALDYWTLLEAAAVGRPLAFGYWFEYDDEELDVSSWENSLSWTFPEIPPRIGAASELDEASIQDQFRKFFTLPQEFRSDLRRSMYRFTLSQCRTQTVDRILDLALAFEIAVSGEGENTPISWKVSVRTAQLIGGSVDARQLVRQRVSQLYQLRNRATHGSRLNATDGENLKLIGECSAIYRQMLRSFFDLGAKPDWRVLELEPRTRD